MLFVLTGNIQIGKSRWLERLVDDLRAEGIESYGVISAGVWVESVGEQANDDGFEKIGIDSILLPGQERFPFAKRVDLARSGGTYDGESQAGKMGLGWHISDAAIDRVNEHLTKIAEQRRAHGIQGLLVIDELGRLELERNEGLTEAMRLLSDGPDACFPHALMVVRSELASRAIDRFKDVWGDAQSITPGSDAFHSILENFD